LAEQFPLSLVDRIDSRKVHETYARWPSLAREGFGSGLKPPRIRPRKAYFLGMGGSAAGGDILASWLYDRPGVEVAVFKGQLPIEDMSEALAIACSASGDTVETISMLKTAVERHATAVSISSGGRLLEVSKELGVPHLMMPKIVAPRYMLPFIIFACVSLLNKAFRLECEAEVDDAITEMGEEGRKVGLDSPMPENQAKALALRLLKMTPVIYGSRVTRGVGIRFKNVLNENSKKHALFDGIPDVFHNEIEAWEEKEKGFAPVFLRHSAEGQGDRTRTDSMVRILSDRGAQPIELRGRGATSLAQLVTMAYRLDMVSYYTAIALRRDPFPTRLIDDLKKKS
jgi:glucose/mannose-6-phosphate isomerase